jgi:hypothetical protein
VSTQLQPGGGLSIEADEELRGEINDHIGYCAATRGKINAVKATKTTKRIVRYNNEVGYMMLMARLHTYWDAVILPWSTVVF